MKVTYFIERRDGKVLLFKANDIDREIIKEEISVEVSKRVKTYDQKFEMGFVGTGPQQLALAILLDACPLLNIASDDIPKDKCREFMLGYLTAQKIRITSLLESVTLPQIREWLRNEGCLK